MKFAHSVRSENLVTILQSSRTILEVVRLRPGPHEPLKAGKASHTIPRETSSIARKRSPMTRRNEHHGGLLEHLR